MSLNSIYGLQLRRGEVYGTSAVYKFGYSAGVSTDKKTISDAGNDFDALSSAQALKLSSSSEEDAAAGDGARTVRVEGVDGDYVEISEEISLNGQTAVNTTKAFLRVYRAYVLTAGSTNKEEGDIYIGYGTVTSGVPASVLAKITQGESQTLMATWTVPRGHTAYISRVSFSSGTEATNKYVTGRLEVKEVGSVYRTKEKVSFGSGEILIDLSLPITVPEKSDVKLTAISSSGTQDCSGSLIITYQKN